MKLSIILAHPNRASFCHAIAQSAIDALPTGSHEIAYHDLYSERFDPLMDADEVSRRVSTNPLVEAHCAQLAAAEGLIIIHPSWWGSPPAIMKGWIDRVIRPGVAYALEPDATGARTRHIGLLKLRGALVFNTADLPPEVERTKFGDTLGVLWQTYIAALCGIPDLQRHSFGVMATSTPERRAAWLAEVRDRVRAMFG